MLLAVLEKRVGLQIQNQDVYINVVGGIKVNEPSIDLGNSNLVRHQVFRNLPVDESIVVTGEIGLTGEVRAVKLYRKRIAECKKLGFKKLLILRIIMIAVQDIKGIEIFLSIM